MTNRHPPRPARIIWPIHHNTQDEVISTTLRHENHQVSRVGVRGWGSYDVRGCCDERANLVSADQSRRLVVAWTATL